MESRSIHSEDGSQEIGCIVHEGKEFCNGGFYRDARHLIAYLAKDHTVTKWDGTVVGKYRVTSSWRTPRSFISSTMSQVVVTLDDGSIWTGRSAGEGMIFKGKPKK